MTDTVKNSTMLGSMHHVMGACLLCTCVELCDQDIYLLLTTEMRTYFIFFTST